MLMSFWTTLTLMNRFRTDFSAMSKDCACERNSDSISSMPPKGFERLVLDLLEGNWLWEGEVVGRSGDDGVDVIINQDSLGLEKVYIQVQALAGFGWFSGRFDKFSGVFNRKVALKACFVTNSCFTKNARLVSP